MKSASRTVRIALRSLGVSATALVFVACSDAFGPAPSITEEQAAAIGSAVATEIAASVATLDPAALDGSAISLQRLGTSTLGPLATSRQSPALGRLSVTEPTPCPVLSEDPPTDTDGDGVPDDLTFTFKAPNCVIFQGSLDRFISATGTIHVTDPQPQTPGFAHNLTYSDFTIGFQSPDTSFAVSWDGTQSASASQTGLSESHNLSVLHVASGEEPATLITNGDASFTPAEGQSLTPGDPLPRGFYSTSDDVAWQQGGRNFFFSIATSTPLDYDPACLETGDSPFRTGEVHVVVSGTDGRVFVRVQWSNCNEPTVAFIGTTA
ncbi:MAG TPA: hypothetical protein VFK13_02320 [Gemmatimonadaceae bacterium]|nr:hypothetical protein [Gemmatimonadaceae bacterium]